MQALLLFAVLVQAPDSPRPDPPPGTDLYLLPLTGPLSSLRNAKPSPISTAPGYDNQPMFSPDGGRILFAANHDGAQTDVFVFDRVDGRVSQLTRTPENENSPTYLPEGMGGAGGFSVVRTEAGGTQRLWRFDAKGGNPQLVLTDVEPVGYHAWVDREWVALFVLGEPSTLRIANVGTGEAKIAAERIGRSLHRVPGTRLISFVHRDGSGEFWIKQIDVDSRKVDPLVQVVEGNTERDMAWMPDGRTILMSGGTKVFTWTRGGSGWSEAFDAALHGLGAVSRLAVSPNADAIAIVVTEPERSVRSR